VAYKNNTEEPVYRDIPVTDFSNLPAELQTMVNNDSFFSSAERTTIMSMDAAARLAAIASMDELMLRYIGVISLYRLNQYALGIFNSSGSGYEDIYIIQEGMVDNANLMITTGALGIVNSSIFGLFIGLTTNATLTGGQITQRDAMHTGINNNTTLTERVIDRKNYRKIYPI
jgi:hypothetical protein